MEKPDEKKKTLSLGAKKPTLGISTSESKPAPLRGRGQVSRQGAQVEVVRKRKPAARTTLGRRKTETKETVYLADTKNTDNLTPAERANRNKALEQSRKEENVVEAPKTVSVSDVEEQVAANINPEEDRRRREMEEMQSINEQEEIRRREEVKRHVMTPPPAHTPDLSVGDEMPSPSGRVTNRRREVPDQPKKVPSRRGDNQQRRQRNITITEALDGGETMRQRSMASVRRAREREKAKIRNIDAEPKVKQTRDVTIPDAITVQELANRMAERVADVVKELMKLGIMATATQTIDAETAELIVIELGHKSNRVSEADVDIINDNDEDEPASLKPRPPVVTVMGHVDHGKTSILDAIRAADVAAGEAGGITQHIGAYQVNSAAGNTITFIDTPGHEAFTEMRVRGANITDIVILVVAGDDGIKPQTIEAINHAKAANCPIIIAINKCDKPEADSMRVRNELLSHDIVTEDFGGDVLCVDVSAHTKMGLDKLEELIMLQAELLELKANPDRAALGAVIEAKVERGRGSVASLLVQRGTLRIGDIFVVGAETGRVRAMYNDRGEQVKTAKPGDAVEVLGLQGTPMAGDQLTVVESEARAREVSEYRQRVIRQKEAASGARGSVEQMLSAIAAGEVEELPIVIKTDVHGSLEAIKVAVEKLASEEIKVRILSAGVGAISESDINLAAASDGLIIAFNVRANPQAREQARRHGIEIRYHSIIYELIDEIKAAMVGLLSPETKETFIGYAEILEVFNITKTGKVAGCKITEGVIKRGCRVRLLRDNVVLHEGSLKTLKRFKDEVKEVIEGQECGMGFENYGDLQSGDVIECFEVQQIARSL